MSGINGIICVNKPQDFTSFDVTAVMRRAAGTRKIGHGGTLDPMATGVLPVFIGRAAKAADLNPAQDKSYRAGFKLGLTTDTEDIWGTVQSENDAPADIDAVTGAVGEMRGEIMQTPSMYSAVKIGGKKLYELARQGVEIERPARAVTVYRAQLVSYDENTREGVLDIACSKGTYIRTIISDIGKRLGTGAVMTSIVRTSSGGFTLDDCEELEALRNMTPVELEKIIIPTERIFARYDEVVLDDKQKRLFLNGAVLDMGRMGIAYHENTNLRIKDGSGTFLGLGTADSKNGRRVKFLNVLG